MRNFNTARTIDLREYLPEPLKGVLEMQAITDTETPEIQAEWQACEDCMNDQFISEATENGIARRERMLSIVPYSTDTLEDRRMRVSLWYKQGIPYTRRGLISMLESLFGADGYTVEFINEAFTVNVKLALTVKRQQKDVWDLLERVLPYNMEFSVELMYNTWGKVRTCTWGKAARFTWKEIKEEVLD